MGIPNTSPFELIASQDITLWVATTLGSTIPDVDEDPSVAWTKLGSYGNLNYHPDGAEVTQDQTIQKYRALGDTGVRKVSRTEDDLMFKIVIWDLTAEQYKFALNGNTITTTAAGAGQPGKKKVGLSRGSSVQTLMLLMRFPSPYMDDGVGQFVIPICVQTGKPKPKFNPKEPAGLELEFTALVNPSASTPDERYGYLELQTADATS